MKAKLFLIPLTLMSSLLTGCSDKPVYVNTFLDLCKDPEVDRYAPSFDYYDNHDLSHSYMDYGLVIHDVLKDNIDNSVGVVNSKWVKHTSEKYLCYRIDADYSKYTDCCIYVCDTGYVYTEVWGDKDVQFMTYNVGTEKTDTILSSVENRIEEIETIREEDYSNNKEQSSPDNLMKAIKDATTKPYVSYYEYGEGGPDNDYYSEFMDSELKFYDGFKDLEYTPIEYKDRTNFSSKVIITYYLTDDWQLSIYPGTTNSYACIFYSRTHTRLKDIVLEGRWYTFYYSINNAKAKALEEEIEEAA